MDYIYVDDPISSLDDNNAIVVAAHLAELLENNDGEIKTVISSHHALFFNVVWNELRRKKVMPYFMDSQGGNDYTLQYTGDTPFFHHVTLLKQLHQAAESGKLYTYHFNILRSILEKTATFHGFDHFSACIKQGEDNPDSIIHTRIINVLSHGNYSLFEPKEMQEDSKIHFRQILEDFKKNYRFNPELF